MGQILHSRATTAEAAVVAFRNRLPKGFIMRFFFALIVVLSVLSASSAGAGEAGTKAPLTLEQFKEALPDERSKELDLNGFLALQKEGSVTVLDVRSESSFAKRHLKGAVNAPLTDLTEKTLPVLAPDKNASIVLVCDYSFQPMRMIAMTMQAYPVLKANGYKNIYRLNLWQKADGGILSEEDIEKSLAFEGAEENPAPETPDPSVVCTMEAKLCPDGSYVSRTGPHCAFAPCAP